MIFTSLGNSEYLIHHPSQVELFSVTREQLELLANGTSSNWEGKYYTAFSVFMTCLINILALGWNLDNASFRLNLGISIISFALGIFFYIKFKADKKRQNQRLNDILNQPLQKLDFDEEPLKD